MKLLRVLIALLASVFICNAALADDGQLRQRVSDLEKRVAELELQMEEVNARDRWKDPILWQRVKREMSSSDIRKLLGKPARIEEQVFTTWYYHPTSKLHSFVWFDGGKVLGWEDPE